ncbi:hypothetical protein ABQZ69_02130 [Xanthomonas sp. WHRI 8391]|uniref:Uncharacterized protein n=1 Tax=Xanthomonas hortorum pv. carotae TaxID=487904 RepID=A0A6V7D0T3_9XANT|nr:hypothetical protein [Xanthomonas hortorum]ETC88805.1 hypothetical protein XHC_1668 [Xanthomonas hortorum pv. carotae str. M081]MBG3850986.1 hypothetical protein [Xanthomonas hortorum pv. carotae]UTS72836.1 hypothetical protein NMB96_20775 [Xanthomonas hortorum]CAD0325794.1 hypothetical protein CFBP7900_16310 [Xanthomonas hortorum pv. carotae]CAD0325803.1 hypothetical protein CFBP7900_16310 [Xanthomonas hortorum pv. carotae]
MQQHAVTRPQISSAGPYQEATTPVGADFDLAAGKDCSAIATLYITHDAVVAVAALTMGQHSSAAQRWERRRGPGKEWKLISGPRLTSEAGRISNALAEFMDDLDFPFDLANMLPRRPTAAAEAAIAAAAREVAHA